MFRSAIIPILLLATPALADDLAFPGFDSPDLSRPSYREAVFPPPQHDLFGQPAPLLADRPSYSQADAFPPRAGRLGGGFIEYVMTGGRPEAVEQSTPLDAAPSYGAVRSGPRYAQRGLPRGGLPEYSPQPQFGPSPLAATPASELGADSGFLGLFGGASLGDGGAVPASYGGGYDPLSADPGLAARPIDPMFVKQTVSYGGHERAGTIIIDTPQKFLYLVQGDGQAIRYGIGVGRPGFAWSGVKSVSRKAEWPGWTPPPEMLRRRPDLPRHMVGGQANPLGARALYLGSSMYRIHGTNEPYTIGTNVSSGCIRMMNQDVIDLYGRVGVGTRVVVM